MTLNACWPAGTVPVLDLQASDDTLASARAFPCAEDEVSTDRVSVVVVHRAGHALVPEQPRAVADALVCVDA